MLKNFCNLVGQTLAWVALVLIFCWGFYDLLTAEPIMVNEPIFSAELEAVKQQCATECLPNKFKTYMKDGNYHCDCLVKRVADEED